MSERVATAWRALSGSAPESLVESLGAVLTADFGIGDADLLLVDYRLAALVPLLNGSAVTKPGDPAWRCFDHQSEVNAGSTVYLPVTARGERIGVLRCSPGPESAETRGDLAEIATMLGHELQSASLGTDRYTMAARTQRLTLAAEMQWELLPGRCRIRPSFSLAGQLEPSYAVRGDSFDWAEHTEVVSLTVLNGMGEGMTAAMLTALATYALRNARRAGLPLVDQAALADQAIFAQHRGNSHVSALMLELNLTTGVVEAVDAGSPLLMRLRDREVHVYPLEAQFPLGMFEATEYRSERIELQPADRLLVVSDGVSDASGPSGRYADLALQRFARRASTMAPLQVVRTLLGDLRTHLGSVNLEDDAVAVVLDWTGPASP